MAESSYRGRPRRQTPEENKDKEADPYQKKMTLVKHAAKVYHLTFSDEVRGKVAEIEDRVQEDHGQIHNVLVDVEVQPWLSDPGHTRG